MRRYRHRLPVGLPPTLTGRILVPGGRSGPVPYAYSPGLGALGFSFKKAFKSVAKTVGKAAQIATAPMKLGVLAPLKATTWIGKSMGLPIKSVDSLLAGEMKTTVRDTQTAAIIGAGVGIGIVTAGTGTAAMIATLGPAVGQLYAASQPPKSVQAPAPIIPTINEQVSTEYSTAATYGVSPQGQQVPIDPATGKPVQSRVAQGSTAAGGINPMVIAGGVAALGVLAFLLIPKKRAAP